MNQTIDTWEQFREQWGGVQNFLMAGACVPFSLDLPPLPEIVEEVRQDKNAQVGSGEKGDKLMRDGDRASFVERPIEEVMASSFSLAHFQLSVFDQPGGFLHGLREKVVEPWQDALRDAGFTWDRCYPIVFISGRDSATNYHMDFSHVLAWQVYGRKRFCGLKEPDRWAPREIRVTYAPYRFHRPSELSDEDAVCYDMQAGDVLWNTILTPHWVEAGEEAAMSINLSHGGLRLNGELCPHEQELVDFREAYPDVAPGAVKSTY